MGATSSVSPLFQFGSPYVHLVQTRDADGKKLAVPQTLVFDQVSSAEYDFGEDDVKASHGRGRYAIHAGKGKSKIQPSFETNEISVRSLARLLGKPETVGGTLVHSDKSGVVVPAMYSSSAKIRQVKSFHLGKWVAHTSMTIAGSAATVTTSTPTTGKFAVAGGVYTFAKADIGKTAVITYNVAGGGADVEVVSTFKIPAGLIYDVQLYSKLSSANKTGASGWFTKDTYSLTSAAPASRHYQAATNGVFVFNSAEAVSVTIAHTTSGVSVSSVVATLPSAGYYAIIDPPSSTVFVSCDHVELVSDTGTAMTSVAAGESLTQHATPTTGQYDVDAGGVFTFAAADVGDVVKLWYVTDYEYVTVTPPNGGDFVQDLGVRNEDGNLLTRVDLTSPIALLPDQYAVSASGTYYFDLAQRGDRLWIDFEYTTADGASVNIENDAMGPGAEFELIYSGEYESNGWKVKYNRVMVKGIKPSPKQDDATMYKITFETLAKRMVKEVAEITMGV